jgi:ribonuclease HII
MTYAAAYWLPDDESSIPKGLNDSKQLTPEKRAALFKEIRGSDTIGFVLRVIHASEISRNMLRRVPYNLNAMSHDAAMEMIWAVIGAGVRIETW